MILVGVPSLVEADAFFANEVPGVVVPPAIQDRMRKAAEGGPEHEKAEGLAIARELAAGIAKRPRDSRHADGQAKTAGEILEALSRRSRKATRFFERDAPTRAIPVSGLVWLPEGRLAQTLKTLDMLCDARLESPGGRIRFRIRGGRLIESAPRGAGSRDDSRPTEENHETHNSGRRGSGRSARGRGSAQEPRPGWRHRIGRSGQP
jgi:hypothetical protein